MKLILSAMKQEHCSTSLASAWAINSLAYSIVYPFIPIYLHEERNIPMDVVGTIFPLMGLAVILAPPLSGWLTDRIGRNFMMQSGQGLRGAIFLVLALFALRHAPFWAFALLLMVNSAVGTFFQVAAATAPWEPYFRWRPTPIWRISRLRRNARAFTAKSGSEQTSAGRSVRCWGRFWQGRPFR